MWKACQRKSSASTSNMASMRPTNTLKSILVHSKDKKDVTDNSDVVYDVPCGECEKSYIGETGRQFGICLKEYQKDVEKKYTRATRKASTSELHKLGITDHFAQANHVIERKQEFSIRTYLSRKIRESIEICQKGAMAINRDKDIYTLDHVYDSLLMSALLPGKATTVINRFPGKSSEPKPL